MAGKIVIAIIVVEAVVEILVDSEILSGLRDRVIRSKAPDTIKYFVACGYCQSFWAGMVAAWFLGVSVWGLKYEWVVWGIVIHRLSNVWHGLVTLTVHRRKTAVLGQ